MLIHICGFLIFSEIYIAHIFTFHKEGLEPYVENVEPYVNDGLRDIYIIMIVNEGENEKRRTSKEEKP